MEELLNYILIFVSSTVSVGTLIAISRHCYGFLNVLRSCTDCFCVPSHTPSHLDSLPLYHTRPSQGRVVTQETPAAESQLVTTVTKATDSNLPSTAVLEA